MTVNYMHKTNSSPLGLTLSVLLRWHGGLFQAVYSKLLMYIFGYVLVAFFYQFILKTEGLEYYRWLVENDQVYIYGKH